MPVNVTGVQGTTQLGTAQVVGTAVVNVTGVLGTVVLGTVTPTADAIVNVTGVQATAILSTVLVWGDIDDNQNPNWTDINTGTSTGWTDINTPGAAIDLLDGPMFGGSSFSTSPLSTAQRIRYTPANDVWTDIAA